MPTIYEYFGIIFLLRYNDHSPIHVHAKKAGHESKLELHFANGKLLSVKTKKVAGKLPLQKTDLDNAIKLVSSRPSDIVKKWNDVVIYHKEVKKEIIKGKIK